jgi:hypothetical protein
MFPGMNRKECERVDVLGNLNAYGNLLLLTKHDPFRLATVTEKPAEVSVEDFRVSVTKLFCAEFSRMLTRIINEKVCRSECGEMRATEEWNFLCSAHPKPKECSAIDYMKHTVDQCAAMMLLLHTKNAADNLPSILRRLYRILAHLYFHHEEFFTRWEEESALCSKITHFLETNSDLVPKETLIVPRSAFDDIAY